VPQKSLSSPSELKAGRGFRLSFSSWVFIQFPLPARHFRAEITRIRPAHGESHNNSVLVRATERVISSLTCECFGSCDDKWLIEKNLFALEIATACFSSSCRCSPHPTRTRRILPKSPCI